MSKKEPQTEAVQKGWKVTDGQMRCHNYQFELGKYHVQPGKLVICSNGFHFCEKLAHCFNYYSFDKNNRVFEIEAVGETEIQGDKSCVSKIKLVRELMWDEVLKEANQGSDNTGHSNTGDRNTGYSNTGDRNTGDSNTGYSNTGDRNTGDSNTGYSNTGDRNTGYSNTGDSNTGDWNTGDSNTGYSNTGDRNTGVFCTGAPETIVIFDKPSTWTIKDFQGSDVFWIMAKYCNTKIWVPEQVMTDEEKAAHRGWKAAEGFIRDIPFKEAFTNMWHNLSDQYRKMFTDLPNFDAKIFETITGVKVGE